MERAAQDVGTRIGYSFQNEALLEEALSHRSASGRSYERLEFLGDAILNFVIAEILFKRFPQAGEGQLTRLRARLVRRESLAELAREVGLGTHLRLGGGELKSGGRDRESILADALEAVLAAVYRDGGLDACRDTIGRLFEARMRSVSPEDSSKDPKTRLQEYLQAMQRPLPEYTVVQTSGAAHRRAFTVRCRIEGLLEEVIGHGPSRRKAEQDAAARALELLDRERPSSFPR
ncbi:MAG: ribonuclease III [Gammaproteobacteria bacterium]|nr:ribonuclease III [Gammaproteobacteria bacterium]NIR85696.1 ribonuclease III [Gammaproteobacteria bacterium]NIR90229.1 ribonuclease III [Gammaproteobacteria bacterium]NIU06830.1 ribonuclease III [Gammaproteobacteria bacterium]NIV53763.1 ribonuclease III [Gammaproteobacteria bacterium]